MLRNRFAGATSRFLMAAGTYLALAAGANCAPQEAQKQINVDYNTAWQEAQAQVDVTWFYEQYAKLRYPLTETSKRVMGEMRVKAGLRSEDVCGWAPPAWWRPDDKSTWEAAEMRGWEVYITNLWTGVSKKIPLLLERPTGESASERAAAAKFLGTEAPHPGFVPLLEAVATNPDEHWIVREGALDAVAYIPHGDVVPFYIEQLYQEGRSERVPAYVEESLVSIARGQLGRLTEAHMDTATRQRLAGLSPEQAQQQWRSWWDAQKGTWQYPRRGALLMRMQ